MGRQGGEVTTFITKLQKAILPRTLNVLPIKRYSIGDPPRDLVHEIAVRFDSPSSTYLSHISEFERAASERTTDEPCRKLCDLIKQAEHSSQQLDDDAVWHDLNQLLNKNGRIWSIDHQLQDPLPDLIAKSTKV